MHWDMAGAEEPDQIWSGHVLEGRMLAKLTW